MPLWWINFIIKAKLCDFWNQILHAAYPCVTKSTATKHRSEQNKTHDGDDDDTEVNIYEPRTRYARFWLDLGRRRARLPARPSAQPCSYPRIRPSVLVSHAPPPCEPSIPARSSPLAAYSACRARPSVNLRKPRPMAIATILLLYIDSPLFARKLVAIIEKQKQDQRDREISLRRSQLVPVNPSGHWHWKFSAPSRRQVPPFWHVSCVQTGDLSSWHSPTFLLDTASVDRWIGKPPILSYDQQKTASFTPDALRCVASFLAHTARRRNATHPVYEPKNLDKEDFYSTRNTFSGTWYLPHSRVHKSMTALCA